MSLWKYLAAHRCDKIPAVNWGPLFLLFLILLLESPQK